YENQFLLLSSTNTGMEIRDGRVSGISNKGYKIIENNDLVLSPQNLWLGNININDIGKGIVSPSYKTFKLININNDFLKPLLNTPRMIQEYRNSSTQGASVVRRNLDMDLFFQIKLMSPDIKEQQKIGKIMFNIDNQIKMLNNYCEICKKL